MTPDEKAALVNEIAELAAARLITLSLSEDLSSPEVLASYARIFPNDSDRLLNMIEAQTQAASLRADKLVAAEIAAARQSRWLTALFFAVCLGFAIRLMFLDQLAAPALLLVLPAIMVLRSMLDARHTEDMRRLRVDQAPANARRFADAAGP